MFKIILGISSSIASCKALELAKMLRLNNFEVKIVPTQNCLKLFGSDFKKEFEKNGFSVLTDLFEKQATAEDYLQQKREIPHIQLAKWADLILLAPATANQIGKLANGVYDDLLTNLICASLAKVFLAPAMNKNMWQNPVVQANLKKLENYNYQIIQPSVGNMVCGDFGVGRLANLEVILQKVKAYFSTENISTKNQQKFKKTVLITAGQTTQKIDEIRTISNLSSGETGLLLAEKMLKNGYKIILLTSKKTNPLLFKNLLLNPLNVFDLQDYSNLNQAIFKANFSCYFYQSYQDLESLIIKNQNLADIIFHLAAVSDFEVDNKIKKLNSQKEQKLVLKPLPKLLGKIRKINPKAFLVGFKLTTKNQNLEAKMLKLLKENNLNMVVGNYQTETTGAAAKENRFYLLNKKLESKKLAKLKKPEAVEVLLKEVFAEYNQTKKIK